MPTTGCGERRATPYLVATVGKALAGDIKATQVARCARLEYVSRWSPAKRKPYRWVIDASHPYAEMVSHNLLRACENGRRKRCRYQRPEQLSNLTYPASIRRAYVVDACEIARRFGPRVLLTTGSKDPAVWAGGKRCWRAYVRGGGDQRFRSELGSALIKFSHCVGFPFSADFNAAFYHHADAARLTVRVRREGAIVKVQPLSTRGIPASLLRARRL
ncbi:precorrin-6A/cobalt-precorrin-6A reductase [Salmonella enterica subsp. enterica]|nr:precorrin-6A/cobalt-precorrin-6A reductase [Salmonella enterica subsp. enterica]